MNKYFLKVLGCVAMTPLMLSALPADQVKMFETIDGNPELYTITDSSILKSDELNESSTKKVRTGDFSDAKFVSVAKLENAGKTSYRYDIFNEDDSIDSYVMGYYDISPKFLLSAFKTLKDREGVIFTHATQAFKVTLQSYYMNFVAGIKDGKPALYRHTYSVDSQGYPTNDVLSYMGGSNWSSQIIGLTYDESSDDLGVYFANNEKRYFNRASESNSNSKSGTPDGNTYDKYLPTSYMPAFVNNKGQITVPNVKGGSQSVTKSYGAAEYGVVTDPDFIYSLTDRKSVV